MLTNACRVFDHKEFIVSYVTELYNMFSVSNEMNTIPFFNLFLLSLRNDFWAGLECCAILV